ncbi:hypothetical protein GCM10023194_65040 [Planotetraspora phitsanulokensis]|uniref:Immunity protein 35 domain-containing protein n=1 Tax=Planotetraspora phitsanulokensis TaxID=575192 RepID=A0A8J3U9P7_9ACTN|nr:PepSY domain-containing protein [Planotetraspora phitsanulokensis]GII38579.1 hypothetical protein Pph01_35820 [Planotetraspora phitsanulokensis]
MKVSPDQARELAEEHFGDRGSDVKLLAFDGGYVAWISGDEPEDPSVLPEIVGGGCLVIDGTTGDIAIRPLLGPDDVAEQWRTPLPPPS